MAQSESSRPPPSQPQPSPQALFTIRTAFERFAATVTPEECDDFARTELKHVRDAAIQVEKELAARRSLCNMRRLQPFFQGLDHYSKSVDVLCNGTPFLPWVWAPIKLMLQISADSISAFEKLIEAYGKIADALPRFDRLGAALKHDHNFQVVLAWVYADILEFHRRAYKFVRRKSWKMLFNSMWAHFDSRFNSILARLAYHSGLVDKEAVAVNISEAVERRRLDAQRWDKREAEWRATKLRAVMCWLGFEGTPPVDELDKFSRDCLPGSCDWVINHPNIRPWLADDESNALVWLHGKPGAGKSVICSSIVQAIESRNMNVLFYFCTYLGAINNDSLLLLRSLAAQAIQSDPDLAIYVHDDIISSHPISSRRALMGLFPKLLQNLGSVRLVIDGIDEWNPKEQKLILDDVLQFLSTTSSSYICKILISSRDVPTISRNLRKKTKGTASISLSHEGNSIRHAIERFIEKRLSENQDYLGELDPGGTILPKIHHILVEKSNGMFLWVRLVLDSLEFAYSPSDLREAIAHLPSDLSELYKRILGRICNPHETQKYQKATRILKWICHSRRPLNKFELVYALALTPDESVLDNDKVPITEILELCKPLIEERYDGSMAFVHFSVQEYLDSDACNLFLQVDAHHDLSFACTTLLMNGLQLLDPHVAVSDRLIRVGGGLFRLLPYALEYWTEHFLLYASNGGDINQNHKLIRHLSAMRSKHDQLLSLVRDLRVSSNGTAPREMLDERLELVSQLRIHDLIQDVLRFRNMLKQEGCENGKDVEAYSLCNDRTLFSKLAVEFENSVLCLLSQESVDGLPKDKLESFKSSYASTAFQCRYPSCPNRTAGFASAQLRGQHEAIHVRRIYCKESTCSWSRVGFKNKSGLDNHVRTYHSGVTKILVPSKVRSERKFQNTMPQKDPPGDERTRITDHIREEQAQSKDSQHIGTGTHHTQHIHADEISSLPPPIFEDLGVSAANEISGAEDSHVELMDKLLATGADINAAAAGRADGRTALGQSTEIQTEKIADMFEGTTYVSIKDLGKTVTHTLWGTPEAPLLLAAGKSLLRLHHIPKGSGANSVQGPQSMDLKLLADKYTVTALCWNSHEEITVSVREESMNGGGEVMRNDKLLKVSGEEVVTISSTAGMISTMRWNGPTQTLLTISTTDISGFIRIWKGEEDPVWTAKTEKAIFDAAWMNDTTFVVCGERLFQIYEITDSLKVQQTFKTQATWESVKYEPSSGIIASLAMEEITSFLGIVHPNDPTNLKTHEYPDAYFGDFTFQPQPKSTYNSQSSTVVLAAASASGVTRIWDANQPFKCLKRLITKGESQVIKVAFSADGSLLAAAGPYTVTVWELEKRDVPIAVWSPNGRTNEWDSSVDGEFSLGWDPDGSRLSIALGNQIAIINMPR